MSDENSRSTVDNIRELTEAGKQLIDAGKQVKENLSELSERVERGKQMAGNPWMLIGAAVTLGLAIIVISRRQLTIR